MSNNKILTLSIIIVLGLGVTVILANQLYPKEEFGTKPEPEPQPTPTKVKLNATLWYDSTVENYTSVYDTIAGVYYLKGKGFWIELHNQYSVKAYDLKLGVIEVEYYWNDEEEEWEVERTKKEVSLPFTLEPNETTTFFISDYYENFVYRLIDPEVYGYIIL